MDELVLRTGPYRTTLIGTEIVRASTPAEWKNYGEILRHVDEAKQWAIGDWLVDGKKHYKDGIYKESLSIFGEEYKEQTLRLLKSISENIPLLKRFNKLKWSHHMEVASLKQTERVKDKKLPQGRMQWSDEPDHEKMQGFLKKAEENEWTVKELRAEVDQYKRNKEREFALHNTPEKFDVIYADPPWKYNDSLVEGYGAAVHHYPPMSIEELCKLPIKSISSDNAVLFLWVTSPFLDQCWDVVNAWGFEYKASFVWDKVAHNYGHYNSVRHELLLICTKGNYLPKNDTLMDSVVTVERTEEHSQKPKEFREIVEKLYPEGRRIELFARGDIPEGWKAWGNEINE